MGMILIDKLCEFNVWSVLFRLILTMVLGGLVGLERERNGRPAGLRTHILVCIGSCMTAMIGIFVRDFLGETADPLRVAAQVISGIGFLGVGTILVKEHDHITGLTTAAGLWTTAAVGIAAGYGFYEGAVICTVIVLITTVVLYRLENSKKSKSLRLYIELDDVSNIPAIREWLIEKYQVKLFNPIKAKSGVTDHVGLEIMIPIDKSRAIKEYIDEIQERDEIVYALESAVRQQFSMWR